MFLGIDWEPIMPAITALLVFGTVVLGIAGLYSDSHTKDGKLTRSGWRVAGFMVVLGILTVLSGLANQRIADAKERSLAAERAKQFTSQMKELGRVTGTLQGVSGSLSQLETDMYGSLRTQRELFSVADQNLRMSGALQIQSQANTLSVLQRVFQEGNRIAPERIAVAVSLACFPNGNRLRGSVELHTVDIHIALGGNQYVNLKSEQNTAMAFGNVFHGFLGDLGPLETFPVWRRAQISLQIYAHVNDNPLTIDDAIREREEPSGPPWCATSVELLLNGRSMLRTHIQLTTSNMISFMGTQKNLRIDPRRIPRF